MNTFEDIATRKSYRGKCLPTPVPREHLRQIMEAEYHAPSQAAAKSQGRQKARRKTCGKIRRQARSKTCRQVRFQGPGEEGTCRQGKAVTATQQLPFTCTTGCKEAN